MAVCTGGCYTYLAFWWKPWEKMLKGRTEKLEGLSSKTYPLAPRRVCAVPLPSTFKVSVSDNNAGPELQEPSLDIPHFQASQAGWARLVIWPSLPSPVSCASAPPTPIPMSSLLPADYALFSLVFMPSDILCSLSTVLPGSTYWLFKTQLSVGRMWRTGNPHTLLVGM